MIDRIQAFGDSFIYGTDLSDCKNKQGIGGEHSLLTWPALISKKLNLTYECYAEAGRGNSSILANVLAHSKKNSLIVINWSWIDRFDHHFSDFIWPEVISPDDSELSRYYYKNIHTELDDKFRNLTMIYATQQYLKSKGCSFISTFMDKLILDNKFHSPKFVSILQKQIKKDLKTFPKGQTFLEWSRANNYSESEGWHPLERAHEKAAEYWLPIYQQAINTHTATTKD